MMQRTYPARWLIRVSSLSLLLFSGCGGGGNSSSANSAKPTQYDGPLTATLSVDSADPDGDILSYDWIVTAGTLSANSGRTVKWTVPKGGGLQFAYLTVSDMRGGYAERTLSLELGTPAPPPAIPNPKTSMFPVSVRDIFDGATLRGTFSIVRSFGPRAVQRAIYIPGELLRLTAKSNSNARYNGLGIGDISNLYGDVRFPKLPIGTWTYTCNSDSLTDCRSPILLQGELTIGKESLWIDEIAPSEEALFRLHGHIDLKDGTLCGLINEYKGKAVAPTVIYGDMTAQVNAYGDYALRIPRGATLPPKMTVVCEGIRVDVPVPVDRLQNPAEHVELSVTLNNRAPFVSAISATANGRAVGDAVVDDAGATSNNVPRSDHFLTYKGIDTGDSACAYYLAIGATPSCGVRGELPPNALKFDEWKRMRKLAPYDGTNGASPELRATYVNRVDLNLVRDMHAVKNNSRDFAFYVCNYPRPRSTSGNDVQAAIADARAGKNLIACVAMDYSATEGTNYDATIGAYKPFTKFYVFGPGGNLISSVNLDGRGEKYVPGSCVVCHGGAGYAGKFPRTTFPISADSNGPSANIEARFLPFDLGNYNFSQMTGLRKADQQLTLKQMNYFVRDIEANSTGSNIASTAIMSLIDGWYANSPNRFVNSDLDESYVPIGWRSTGALAAASSSPATAPDFYRQVIARSCRTCHVALPKFDWDTARPVGGAHLCGGTAKLNMNAKMANSKVTFDQFWLTAQQVPAFRALIGTHLGCGQAGVGVFAPFQDP
jgi:mono/diheme cytochrome c family protein